jgi:murein L,D-transpeptidase YafK
MTDVKLVSEAAAGPVDRLVVQKQSRQLYMLVKGEILFSYSVVFGPRYGLGPKAVEGDLKTPEGLYFIEAKNPQSKYHRSYPNDIDKRFAKEQGKSAGSDIMIHGFPVAPVDGLVPQLVRQMHPNINWTRGCMAVTDSEIEEIFNVVGPSTPIEICP